ncbi:MAG: hypothetical protein Q8Q09_10105 [Deltaproteobacteria bacterium]|nr:hypothetical protein [Deltaproteobacteria bacterium]
MNLQGASRLPSARVLVLGRRDHGTSEVIEGLRSLHHGGSIRAVHRDINNPPPALSGAMAPNDFGPFAGTPFVHRTQSAMREYTLWECVDSVNSLFFVRQVPVPLLVWVLDACAPLDGASLEMLECARVLGAERAVVFLHDAHKVAEGERLNALEQDAREVLEMVGILADETPFVRGTGAITPEADSCWREGIGQLFAEMDQGTYDPLRDELALWAAVEVVQFKYKRLVATVTVSDGTLRGGDTVELLRGEERTVVRVKSLANLVDTGSVARAGASAGVELTGVAMDSVRAGDVIVSPGTGRAVRTAQCLGYALGRSDALDERMRAPCAPGAVEIWANWLGNLQGQITGSDAVTASVGLARFTLCFAQPVVLDERVLLRVVFGERSIAVARVLASSA